jgi:hypothetical protein
LYLSVFSESERFLAEERPSPLPWNERKMLWLHNPVGVVLARAIVVTTNGSACSNALGAVIAFAFAVRIG